MKTVAAVCVVGLATASVPANAKPTSDVPWSGCVQMKISKIRTQPYDDEELKTLYCWFGLSNIDAGLEIAKHYQRLEPPDYDSSRKMLLDLAKGTKVDGGSIEARGAISGGGYGTAKIRSDGSITPVAYRPPSPAAQRELAKLYLLGHGVDRDIPKAVDWLKKAEKGGDVEAGILHKALIEKGYTKD
jgi:hypothetical protein